MKKKHRHSWQLIPQADYAMKRHCFGCNTTQELITATKWQKCETARFHPGIDHKTGKVLPWNGKN